MKKLASTLVLCFAVQTAAPTAAHANIWRWIEELSGPGPFIGLSPEFRVKCWGPSPVTKTEPYRAGGATLKFPCPNTPEADTYFQFSFNIQTGILWGQKNPVEYDEELTDAEKKVMLFPVEAIVYWQPKLGVELGAGAGIFIFKNSQRFPTLFVPVIEPLRVDVRPFDLMLGPHQQKFGHKLLRSITARYGLLVFPQKLDGTHFGGRAGARFTPEAVNSYEIAIDLEPFVRKMKP